ncbi:MAG: hypothetical protein A2X56_02095 [Nitrospirae bacterium GWC2_57_13]|nr:MAG: hypothetical protein A2X56_02095 [Nitrospirae bacterium GWC2_57_13]OGW46484.1 MAG: hypothetical protein A2X57_07365 [Nitrospirae bacterium GWD2_57_8]HAS55231.1 hypothetical protein [Nitrospiraceae bacterium]
MKHFLQAAICFVLLFSLTGCGIVRPLLSYSEPTEGPRAKIRIFAGAQTRIYPGDSCFNDDNDAYGFVGRGSNFFLSNRLLGIPMKPKRGAFNEYYLPAGVPVAISYYITSQDTLSSPGYVISTKCGPIGFTFIPGQDEHYETDYEFSSSRKFCSYTLSKIVQGADGAYKKEVMTPTPATWCPKNP